MSKVSQKEATYNSILEVFNANNISFTPNVTDAKLHLNTATRKQVVTSLVSKFDADLVEVSNDFKSKTVLVSDLNKYCNGLVSNWLRKDIRLNGGNKYVAATNSSENKTNSTTVKQAKVKTLKNKSVFVKAIDENTIPENLKHLLS